MAALELHCGLESGGLMWGGDRVDLLDTFDSEMQEWEDQLQEMQRKIEELYNEVKARRRASETNPNNITHNKSLDITFLPVSSGFGQQADGYYHGFSTQLHNNRPVHQCNGGDPSVRHSFELHHHTDSCNSSSNCTLHPVRSGIEIETSPETHRSSSCAAQDEFEEAENKINKRANLEEFQASHLNRKEALSSNNLPLKNVTIKPRDAPPVPPRSTSHESSQQQDRKCLLVDRKSCSPSVLRKFGAMLQENEGKTLIEDGVTTTVILTEHLASTPICQRRFSAGRAAPRVPVQKSLVDCDVVRAELEAGQEPRAAATPRHMLINGDSVKGVLAPKQCSLAFNLSPSQSPLKAGHQRKTLEAEEHKMGFQSEDLFSDYRMVERILGTGSQHYGKAHTGLGGDSRWRNHNLDQLLEMMEIENSRGQRAAFTQQHLDKQVSRETSPVPRSSSFSRPTRPANQRRPSRWATPTPREITSCPASPCVNGKQFLNSYCLQTETVIM